MGMEHTEAWEIGRQVFVSRQGRIPSVVLVRTDHSWLEGVVSPDLWAAALAGLFGAELPQQVGKPAAKTVATVALPVVAPVETLPSVGTTPWKAFVADTGDIAALPACIRHWGRQHTGAGAMLPLTPDGSFAGLLAISQVGYQNLCGVLSWRHEFPSAFLSWANGLSHGRDLTGIVGIVADNWAGRLLEQSGAKVLSLPSSEANYPTIDAALLWGLDGRHCRTVELLAQMRKNRPIAGQKWWRTLEEFGHQTGDDRVSNTDDTLPTWLPAAPDAHGRIPWLMPPWHGADADAVLRARTTAGIERRYGNQVPPELAARLTRELDIIARKGFSSYFLVVQDLAAGRRTCGRGSGASSLVSYLLGITNIDPIRNNLLFERFLSDAREDPPDLDVDFPWDERDAVLQLLLERHGRDHVAIVSTHQSLGSRGALREAARLAGQDRTETSSIQDALSRQRHFGISADLDDAWDPILDDAAALEGQPRGWGLHCGGVVITPGPIRDLVPIHPAAKTVAGEHLPAISWEKDGAEEMGLVKIDLLGNRALAVVRDCLQDLAEQGVVIDEARWRPEEDPLARRLVAQGKTMGCFYIESPAMRLLNAKAASGDFDRLVVHSSIIRPAANRWIKTYLERLHAFRSTGRSNPTWYPHPVLANLLSESFGILSYQEDVMLVARELAGFNTAQQDKLRKCLGKSDAPLRLAMLADPFRSGARSRGVEDSIIDHVWTMISSFAGYSFCKAHSASYAMVSFQCAWLKAHHPAVFLSRVIANGGGFYSRHAYVEEARRIGVRILSPSVLHGQELTAPAGARSLRLGLDTVKHLTHRTITAILTLRPFSTLDAFIHAVKPSDRELQYLDWAGALEGLCGWNPAATQENADRHAYAALGCLPRAHPFAIWNLTLRRQHCSDVIPQTRGRRLNLWAWPIAAREVEAHKKNQEGTASMGFVTLEDESGICECVAFPAAYQKIGPTLNTARPIAIQGRVEVEFGVATIVAA